MAIDKASADQWLSEQLSTSAPGQATVVMHSAVMQYLRGDIRSRVEAVFRRFGRKASHDAPLARLSFEPGQKYFALQLELWPRDVSLTLADAHPHGAWADWRIGTGPQ